MELESEIDAIVSIACSDFSSPPRGAPAPRSYQLALKRFEKELPTAEAKQAYVDAFVRRNQSLNWTRISPDNQVREAFRFWFLTIWPNLPEIRRDPRFRSFQNSVVEPRYFAGLLVVHDRKGYRGVIAAIDRTFRGTDAWYERHARSLPPKNRPWYRVLVHESLQVAYVPERDLLPERCPAPVKHPLLERFFQEFSDGVYRSRGRS